MNNQVPELQQLTQQYLLYLEKTKRMSIHTVTAYQFDLSQFIKFLDGEAISEPKQIKSGIIRSFMANLLEENLTPRSVHRKISSIRGWFKFMRKQGILTSDPMAKVLLPKMPKTLVKDIPATDLMNLFNRFPWNEEEHGERDRLLLLLFYTTGMRLSELINLKVADIDFYRGSLKVLGKRNKERLIPIHPETSDILKQYLTNRSTEVTHSRNQLANNVHTTTPNYLFQRNNGEALYPIFVYRLVNKYLKLFSHASKTSPHVLRHSFATHMLNNGANLLAIKDILGHANLSATQVYTKNSFEKLKKIHQLHPRE
ncbi:MAG: tyrosine-type recombinase/integrase [Bacteroidota bacterium]|jgi:integrase/recombinase XerC